jgi:cell division protein ZipA
MDADLLRLILFLAGIGLILGIYYWDRHKKVESRVHAIKKARAKEKNFSAEPPRDRPKPTRPSAADEHPQDEEGDIDEALQRLEQIVAESADEKKPGEKSVQSVLSFSAADPDEGGGDRPDRQLPRFILQLNILARNGKFSGEDLLKTTKELGLQYGDMAIFHRKDIGSGKILFSMASMVEPGTFPQKKLAEFSTPGVTLFAQLPGPRDGLAIFSDMLFTAERIASMLSGEIQDQHHSDLTKQTIGHIREQILEHRRQVQLAKSRR